MTEARLVREEGEDPGVVADVVTVAPTESLVTLSSMAFRAPEKSVALEAAQEVSRRSARAA